MEINNLSLYIQDKKDLPIGCGYYYIIKSKSMSHTAFRTKEAFKTWLKITGIKIGRRYAQRGNVKLVGQYTSVCEMLNTKDFLKKYAHLEPYYALSNGEYTIGFYEQRPEGNILYYQNPNTDRPILDYKKVREHLETGKELRLCF